MQPFNCTSFFKLFFLKNEGVACKVFIQTGTSRLGGSKALSSFSPVCHYSPLVHPIRWTSASLTKKKMPDLQVSSDLVKGNKNLPAGSGSFSHDSRSLQKRWTNRLQFNRMDSTLLQVLNGLIHKPTGRFLFYIHPLPIRLPESVVPATFPYSVPGP